MSDFLDKAKDLAKDLTARPSDAVTEHSDKIDDGIDKAAEFVDEKTKGKYPTRSSTVQAKAHEVVDRIADRQGRRRQGRRRTTGAVGTPPADAGSGAHDGAAARPAAALSAVEDEPVSRSRRGARSRCR